MTSIDNRVVRMEFDNAQFEKGVSSSLKSLKNLDKALKLDEGSSGFENIQKAADNLNFGTATKEFNAFQKAAQNTLKTITTSLTNFSGVAKKALGMFMGIAPLAYSAVSGWQRAMGLDEAKFKFEGLIDETKSFEAEWNNLKEDIIASVNGSAYTFTQAAGAASQLVASGIEYRDVIDETDSAMQRTLTAITGLTAMTGSSYEEISQIITQMAATGKVTNDDLERFSTRSLKASKTLADSLEITEEELRAKLKKGEVDFMTFIDSMNKAYGTHALEATKTLKGALARMKSFVGQIGEKFATPIQQGLRTVVNAITPFIEDITKIIERTGKIDLFSLSGEYLGSFTAVKSLSDNMSVLATNIESMFNDFRNNEAVMDAFKTFISSITYPVDLAAHAVMELGTAFTGAISKIIPQLIRIDLTPFITTIYQFLYEIVDLAAVELGCLGDIAALIADIFGDLWSIASGPLGTILDIVKNVVGGTMKGLFTSIRYVTFLVKKLFDGLNQFTNHLMKAASQSKALNYIKDIFDSIRNSSGVFNGLSSTFASVGEAIVEFFDKVALISSPVIEGVLNVFDSLVNLGFTVIAEGFKAVSGAISELVKAIGGFFEPFGNLGQALMDWDAAKTASDNIKAVLDNIASGLDGLADSIKNGGFLQLIKDAVSSISEFVSSLNFGDIFSPITSFFEGLGETIGSFFQNGINFDTIGNTIHDKFKDAFGTIGTAWSEITGDLGTSVSNFFNNIADSINNVSPDASAVFSFLGDFFGNIGDTLAKLENFDFGTVFDNIKTKFDDFVTFLSGITLEGIAEKISTEFENFSTFFGGIATSIGENLSPILETIGNVFGGAATIIGDFLSPVTDVVNHAITEFCNLIATISPELFPVIDNIYSLYDAISDVIDNIFDLLHISSIFDFFETINDLAPQLIPLLEPALQTLSKLFDVVMSLGSKALDIIGGLASQFMNLLSGVDINEVTKQIIAFVDAAGNFINNTIIQGIINLGTALSDLVSPMIPPLLEALGNAFNWLSEQIQTFASIVGGVLGGAGEKISEFFNSVKDAKEQAKESAGSITDAIGLTKSSKHASASKPVYTDEDGNRRIGIDPNAKEQEQEVSGLAAAFAKLTSSLAVLGSKIAPLMSTIGEFAMGALAVLADTLSSVIDFVTGASDKLPGLTKAFGDAGGALDNSAWGQFVDMISRVAKAVGDAVGPYLTLENAISLLSTVISGFMLGTFGKFMTGLSEIPGKIGGLADSIGSIPKAADKFAEGMQNIVKGFAPVQKAAESSPNVTVKIKELAVACLLLAAAAFVIANIDSEMFWQSAAAVAAFVGILAAAVTLSTKAVIKSINGVSGTLAKFDGKLGSISADLSKLTIVPSLFAIAAMMVSLAASVLILAFAMKVMSEIDPERFAQGLGGMFTALLMVTLAVSAMALAGQNAAKAGAGILLLAIAIRILIPTIEFFAGVLENDRLRNGAILLGGLLVGLVLLSKVFSSVLKDFVGAGAAILILSVALHVLISAIERLGSIDMTLDKWAGSILVLGVLLAGMAAATRLISPSDTAKFISAAIGISIIAYALKFLIEPITELGAVWEKVGFSMLWGVASLSALLIVLTIALNVLAQNSAGMITGSIALTLASAALLMMGNAIATVAVLPWQAVGVAMVSFIVGLAALTVAMAALSVLGKPIAILGAGMLAFGAGLMAVGLALPLIAGGLITLVTTLPFVIDMFSMLADKIKEEEQPLVEGTTVAVKGMASGFSKGIGESLPEIIATAGKAVMGFLQGIGDHAGEVINEGLRIVYNFIIGIANNLGSIINAGIVLITSFISGIGRGLAQNKGQLVTAVWDIFNGILQVVVELLASLVEKIPVVGSDLANGMRSWIEDVAPVSEEVANEFADSTVNSLEDSADSIGKEGVSAVADSLEGNAEEAKPAGEAVASSIGDGILSGMSGMDITSMLTNMDANGIGTAGFDLGSAYGANVGFGIEDSETDITDSVENVSDAAGDVDTTNNGKRPGGKFGQGFLSGIQEWRPSILSEVRSIGSEAESEMDRVLDSHSPSREMEKRGHWFAEGFLIGISDRVDAVNEVAGDMAVGAKGAVNEALTEMDRLINGIDWDAQPTIRPIFDGTEAIRGMQELNAMMPNADLSAAGMIGTYGSRAFGSSESSVQTNNTFNITLDWEAGMDANDMVMALSNALRSQSLMYA